MSRFCERLDLLVRSVAERTPGPDEGERPLEIGPDDEDERPAEDEDEPPAAEASAG
jgi:hypothetical protein